MDVVDSATRSKMMSGIKGKNTRPEMIVRKFLHANGYRFRLHRKDLPGNPDIVIPKLRSCIFVHGCFWHRHPGCKYATTPKTRVEFWEAKFAANTHRDLQRLGELKDSGWNVIIVWECQLKRASETLNALLKTLDEISSERLRQ